MNTYLNIGFLIEESDDGNDIFSPFYLDEEKLHNRNMFLLGASGSGKTSLMTHLAISKAENGETVVLFDYDDIYSEDQINPDLLNRFKRVANEINIYEDGFRANILTPCKHRDGTKESVEDVADEVAAILARNMKCAGPRQVSRLREAIMGSVHLYEKMGIACVQNALEKFEDDRSDAIIEKLGGFFRRNVFRAPIHGTTSLKEGKVNILRLSNLPSALQYAVAELILTYLFKQAKGRELGDGIVSLCLDEAHNLSGAQDIVSSLLSEGRKYGLSVMVATQSLGQIKKNKILEAAFQSSVQFYFRPAKNEIAEMGRLINLGRSDRIIVMLKDLERGEYFVVGSMVGKEGKLYEGPIKIKAVFKAMAYGITEAEMKMALGGKID